MTEKPRFEEALSELETRVRKLEAGEVTLDEALQLFEEGVSLANNCHTQLDAAEDRISSLSRGQGGIQETSLPEPKGE